MSIARQNYDTTAEEGLNAQINMELKASHIYLSMYAYFSRPDVALPGLAKFFKDSSDEEREHGEKMIEYQNMRGGKVVLQTIQAPEIEWGSAKNAMEFTLSLEKEVNKALLKLHSFAEQSNDPQFCDFIEGNFLNEQVEAIEKISNLLTQLNRVGGEGLGLYLWDQELLKHSAH
ncbi:ferritin-like superfamily [Catenaria anguillulae PL171]|uniref:Ferritin n=1 Tax=Catenaria anguillulae PL171 TaxID=765915 RepID=A0A1Y2HWA1_9FUNG|nr:ferritin-like superfamily [Catenaria anguillulae PL171]